MVDIIRLDLDLRSSLRPRSRMSMIVLLLLIKRLPPLIEILLHARRAILSPLLVILPLRRRSMRLDMIVLILSRRNLSTLVILFLRCIVRRLMLYRLDGLS